MSTIEDNPFKKSDDAAFSQAPRQGSGTKKWLLGCGIVGLIGMLICCGGMVYFASKGPQFLSNAVNAAMAEQLRTQLASEPSVQQHIGQIEALEFDFTQTVENAQKAQGAGGEPRLAFKIRGSNGQGVVLVVQDGSGPGGAGIKSGTLVMDDGTEYPLDIEAMKSAGPSSLDINFDDAIDDGQTVPSGNAPAEVPPISLEVDTSVGQ